MVDKDIAARDKEQLASGIEYGKMSERHDDKEQEFPYVKLQEFKPEILQNIIDFYGINESFPRNLLYF